MRPSWLFQLVLCSLQLVVALPLNASPLPKQAATIPTDSIPPIPLIKVPDAYNERIRLVKQFIDSNHGKEALAILLPLLKEKPSYDVFLLSAQAYAEVNNPQASMDYYKQARLAAKTPSEKLVANKGIIKMQAWLDLVKAAHPIKTTAVLASYLPPLTLNKNTLSKEQRLDLAKKYIANNKGKDAVDILKPLTTLKPPLYDAYLLTAQGYAEIDNPLESLNYFQKARQIAKTKDEQEVADAGIEKMLKWLSKPTKTTLATATKANPSIELAKKYINADNGQQALDILNPLLKNKPDFDVLILTAQSYAVLNKPQLSLEYFQKARQIASTNVQKQIADSGIAKMKKWISQTHAAKPVSNPILDLARKYLNEGKGQQALETLKPLLAKSPNYNVFIITAQSYATMDKPLKALKYYKAAREMAENRAQDVVADFGVAKMQFWLSRYYRAQRVYENLMMETSNPHDYELAVAGKVKSLAYENRPILGYQNVPKNKAFTTPEMVIAAAQASLWSDWADITKDIVTTYQPILQKLPPKSPLRKDLNDLTWQMNQATWPNVITPAYFISRDSVDFQVQKEVLDYTHYWSQLFQTSLGAKGIQYNQLDARLHAKSGYVGQTWRPTRPLILYGQIEPSDFELWHPTLWAAFANYRPNDYVRFNLHGLREVVETFPAFTQNITDNQYAIDLFINPLPYIQVNGSVSELQFSDTNIRKGYFIGGTALFAPSLGLSLILQERGYWDKFKSPFYFSPNHYKADTLLLRLGSRAGSVWHYHLDGGLGTQLVEVTGAPSSPAPTYQWGCGINGPITNWLILSADYLFTTQASSFIDSPNYRYQAGSVSVKILI